MSFFGRLFNGGPLFSAEDIKKLNSGRDEFIAGCDQKRMLDNISQVQRTGQNRLINIAGSEGFLSVELKPRLATFTLQDDFITSKRKEYSIPIPTFIDLLQKAAIEADRRLSERSARQNATNLTALNQLDHLEQNDRIQAFFAGLPHDYNNPSDVLGSVVEYSSSFNVKSIFQHFGFNGEVSGVLYNAFVKILEQSPTDSPLRNSIPRLLMFMDHGVGYFTDERGDFAQSRDEYTIANNRKQNFIEFALNFASINNLNQDPVMRKEVFNRLFQALRIAYQPEYAQYQTRLYLAVYKFLTKEQTDFDNTDYKKNRPTLAYALINLNQSGNIEPSLRPAVMDAILQLDATQGNAIALDRRKQQVDELVDTLPTSFTSMEQLNDTVINYRFICDPILNFTPPIPQNISWNEESDYRRWLAINPTSPMNRGVVSEDNLVRNPAYTQLVDYLLGYKSTGEPDSPGNKQAFAEYLSKFKLKFFCSNNQGGEALLQDCARPYIDIKTGKTYVLDTNQAADNKFLQEHKADLIQNTLIAAVIDYVKSPDIQALLGSSVVSTRKLH